MTPKLKMIMAKVMTQIKKNLEIDDFFSQFLKIRSEGSGALEILRTFPLNMTVLDGFLK